MGALRRRAHFSYFHPMFWSRKIKKATMAPGSYVCTVCGNAYPVHHSYNECLECGLKTHYSIGTRSMPPEELARLKKAKAAEVGKPLTDDQLQARRIESEHRFQTEYEYALREAARRNRIGGAWTAADVLEELLDHQAEAAA